MDSGNRAVGLQVLYVRLPPELIQLIDMQAKRLHFASRSQAVKYLIETHPAIASVIETIYDATRQQTPAGS